MKLGKSRLHAHPTSSTSRPAYSGFSYSALSPGTVQVNTIGDMPSRWSWYREATGRARQVTLGKRPGRCESPRIQNGSNYGRLSVARL
jgi:hypothetical protein